MHFVHIADCHIGCWRDSKMREVSNQAFKKVIEETIEENPDFLLIAGDLFNTAIPNIDSLKLCFQELKKLKQNNITCYLIAGSHDYSPSGKTMLDLLEEADLAENVMKGDVEKKKLRLEFTEDPGTSAKITGILGKRGSLDKHYYEDLDREPLEEEEGFKIFMFHTPITELKTKQYKQMESEPISLLPKNFDYYAGGHIHVREEYNDRSRKRVIYPGPTYPANFSELEKLKRGSYCVYKDGEVEKREVTPKKTINIKIDLDGKTAEQGNKVLEEKKKKDYKEKIVLLRIEGDLSAGEPSELETKEFISHAYEEGAYTVLKNTSKLTSKEFTEYKTKHSTKDKIEQDVIRENAGQVDTPLTKEEEEELTKKLLQKLSEEKKEGEKKYEYKDRMKKEAENIIENFLENSRKEK